MARSLSLSISLLGAAAGCARGPELVSRMRALEAVVAQAEHNGAVRCAPRELATAQSQLRFAALELEQGFPLRAERHFERAEPNAHAARFLSVPEHCAARAIAVSSKEAPDSDADGVPDDVDQCVFEKEDRDQYLDDDGCPEMDNDLDTLSDDVDACPLVAEDPDGQRDADGCPDPDNDGDGVLDADDACPSEAGSASGAPPGCAAEPPLAVLTDCEVLITRPIDFEPQSERIARTSVVVLKAVVDLLASDPGLRLEIRVLASGLATERNDRQLSERRAAAVKKYIVAQGVTPDRLGSSGSSSEPGLYSAVQFLRTEGVKEGCSRTPTQ